MFKYEKNKVKTIVNTTLATLGRRDGIAVVLDGPNIKTTRMLIKHDWSKNQIHVPNNSPDYRHIKNKHYQAYNISLKEFLTNHNNNNVGLIYMDYMCSLNGNVDIRPIEDINLLFSKKLLMDGSALGITISLRSAKKSKSPFKYADPQNLLSELSLSAYDNGYSLIINNCGGAYHNGGTMFTLLTEVIKR